MINVRIEQSDERVRPIPVDIDPEDLPVPAPDREDARMPARRWRRLGAVIVLFAIAIVVAWGTLGERSPDTVTEADETHLGDDADLVLAARSVPDGWSIIWTPRPGSQPTGAIGAIPAPASRGAMAPTIDVSAEWVAAIECVGSRCELGIELGNDPSVVVATVPAVGHVWHADEPARLAWIEVSTSTAALKTGSIDQEIDLVIDQVTVAVDSGARLVRWDDNGFVVEGISTTALDPDGAPSWTADGVVLDATATAVVIEHEDGRWSMLERVSGAVLATGGAGEASVRISQTLTSDPVTTTTAQESRHTFEVIEADGGEVGDAEPPFTELRLDRDEGTEYRLLRSASGDRFTVHVIHPIPER